MLVSGTRSSHLLRRAADALERAGAATNEATQVRMPRLFGRDRAMQRQDLLLDEASTQAREAVALLDDGDSAAARYARGPVVEFTERIDRWRATSTRTDRLAAAAAPHAPTPVERTAGQLRHAADGIDAADAGHGADWVRAQVAHGRDAGATAGSVDDRMVAASLVASDHPGLLGAIDPVLPRQPMPESGILVQRRLEAALALADQPDEALRTAWASFVQEPTADGFGRVPAGYVRQLVDAAAPAFHERGVELPRWLSQAPGRPVPLLPARVAELDLLVRASSRDAVEQELRTIASRRDRDAMWAYANAARELPADLRVELPRGVVERGPFAVERHIVDLHTDRLVQERLAAGQEPTAIIVDLIGDAVGVTEPRLAAALALAEQLPRTDPAVAAVADDLCQQLRSDIDRMRGVLRDGYLGHPDYAITGRARADAELLARLLRSEPDRHAPVRPAGQDQLTW